MVIDEAHRSDFGAWQEILQYFGSAIHPGMTATPKRTDNVDTYAYLCKEEPDIWLDEEHPEQGKRQATAA